MISLLCTTLQRSAQAQFTLLQNIFLEPPICSNTAHWLLEMTTKFREFSRLINIHNRTLLGQYDLLTILLIISCIWRQASQFQVYFLGPSGNIILWNFHEILLAALLTADHTRVTCHVARVPTNCPPIPLQLVWCHTNAGHDMLQLGLKNLSSQCW